MPPKKTKAEEALAFLSDLDNLEAPEDAASAPPAQAPGRPSTDSTKPGEAEATDAAPDAEAADALAFLEAQINQKRAPLSVPSSAVPTSATPRTSSPALSGSPSAAAAAVAHVKPDAQADVQLNVPTAVPAAGTGWGSFWSSATSAIQSAQRVADEQYRKVREEGVSGVRGQLEQLNVGGVDLNKLRKDAEERLGGIVKNVGNVDLDKLRQDLLTQANSTFTQLINTVAPPISEHETIELWLSHPMVGYDGVEGVIYRAWSTILDQTASGELVVVWSPPERELPSARTFNPVTGWDEGWKLSLEEMEALQAREAKNPQARKAAQADVPVTTVPVFLQIQPVLAALPVPEPPLLASAPKPATPPQHLSFIVTIQDPSHGLRFTTVSQPAPGDWLEVEYDRSDWVEERLVEILRNSVEVIAQDYVSTRMGLKPSATSQVGAATEAVSAKDESVTEQEPAAAATAA